MGNCMWMVQNLVLAGVLQRVRRNALLHRPWSHRNVSTKTNHPHVTITWDTPDIVKYRAHAGRRDREEAKVARSESLTNSLFGRGPVSNRDERAPVGAFRWA